MFLQRCLVKWGTGGGEGPIVGLQLGLVGGWDGKYSSGSSWCVEGAGQRESNSRDWAPSSDLYFGKELGFGA